MTENTTAERIAELYTSLSNPDLSDDLARSYIHEYIDLTGMVPKDGSVLFLDTFKPNKLDLFIERVYPFGMLLGLGIIFGTVIYILKEEVWDKRKSEDDLRREARLQILLDPDLIREASTEEFQATIAEVLALTATKEVQT